MILWHPTQNLAPKVNTSNALCTMTAAQYLGNNFLHELFTSWFQINILRAIRGFAIQGDTKEEKIQNVNNFWCFAFKLNLYFYSVHTLAFSGGGSDLFSNICHVSSFRHWINAHFVKTSCNTKVQNKGYFICTITRLNWI